MKKDRSEIYECGYVHKPSVKEKLNPMKALQKGLGAGATDQRNNDLGTCAISVFYQAHLHPQSIMRYPTQTPGWQTCGDAVFAGFTNRNGTGLSSTDGSFLMNGKEIPFAGIGTYFQGFDPSERGRKEIEISSSNGDRLRVEVEPAAPLEILSIDGKAKGEDILIDGSKDIVIELEGGDSDPSSQLHVQLVCKLVGTPVIYDVIVTKAKNRITVPKEAFKNFEGSPSPFVKENTLIVNRVKETNIEGTDAGAIRTLSAYMDWAPVEMGGDIAKGSIMTAGFDESKNTDIKIELQSEGSYQFSVKKDGPFYSPPIDLIKKPGIASFVVRGNLADEKSEKVAIDGQLWVNKMRKWFPEFSQADWQAFVDLLYQQTVQELSREFGWNFMPIEEIVRAKSYRYAKSIDSKVAQTSLELGAKGSNRILTSSTLDFYKDLGISFPSDFVSERLVRELGLDAVIAITIDLEFDFEREALDPKVHIIAFAPNISYKSSAQYFSMFGQGSGLPKAEVEEMKLGVSRSIFTMVQGSGFAKSFADAIRQLSNEEKRYPVYRKLWQAKF